MNLLGASGATISELVLSFEAMVLSLYGPDISDPVIQDLAAKLYKVTVLTSSQTLIAKYKTAVSKTLISIQSAMVTISKQITFIQSELLLLTGKSINLSTLDVSAINTATGEIEISSGSSSTEESVVRKTKKIKLRPIYFDSGYICDQNSPGEHNKNFYCN